MMGNENLVLPNYSGVKKYAAERNEIFSHAQLSNITASDHHAKTVSGDIDHDATINYVANEHIDWTDTTENLKTSGTTQQQDQKASMNPAAGVSYALNFDTGSPYEYVKVNYDASLYSETYTLSFWINSDLTNVGTTYMLNMWDNVGNNRVWGVSLNASTEKFQFVISTNGEGGGVEAQSTDQVIQTGWHHVAIKIDNQNNTWDWWYDGVKQTQETFSGKYTNQSSYITYGGLTNGFQFDGKMDQIAIWDSLIDDTDITDIYNSGTGIRLEKGNTFPTSGNTVGTGLVMLHNMDEGSGSTVADDSDETNTGTLNNMESGDWQTGHVPGGGGGSAVVRTIIDVEDAVGSEDGIVTFGADNTSTEINGRTISYQIAGVEVASTDNLGDWDFGTGDLTTTGDLSCGEITGTKLDIDNITIDGAQITSSSGVISFNNEELSTTGNITAANITASGQTRGASAWLGGGVDRLEVEFSTANVVFKGECGLPYAQIYEEDGSSTLALAAQDTFYQITSFSANGEYNNCTPDYTNDHITVLEAGRYLVNASISVQSAQANEYDFHIQTNNGATDFPCTSMHLDTNVANKTVSTAASGILDLNANDTVEMWVERLDGAAVSKTITIVNASITLMQIGGT